MARIYTRNRDKCRAKSPTFTFATRKLRGVESDSASERAEKERLIKEFLEKRDMKESIE